MPRGIPAIVLFLLAMPSDPARAECDAAAWLRPPPPSVPVAARSPLAFTPLPGEVVDSAVRDLGDAWFAEIPPESLRRYGIRTAPPPGKSAFLVRGVAYTPSNGVFSVTRSGSVLTVAYDGLGPETLRSRCMPVVVFLDAPPTIVYVRATIDR